MAYNPAGHYPPGQHGQHQYPPPGRNHPYGHSNIVQTGQPSTLHRASSFDEGDDGAFPQPDAAIRHHSRARGSSGTAALQNDELRINPQSPPHPPRSTSYGANTTPALQQYTPPALPPRQTYNPQQYGMPQPQPSPQLNNAFATTFNSTYQSYNPAAYQPPAPLPQHQYGIFPSPSFSASTQPPPPPPRPYENSYGSRMSPPSASSAQFSNPLAYRQQPLPPLPDTSNPASNSSYTPPAPPAPPFSPARDAFNSNSPSSSSIPQYAFSPSRPADRSSLSSSHPPSLQHQPSSGSQRMPSPTIHRRPVGGNASLPQTPGTPGPTPPAHSPQRSDTLGRHPQSRPLPGPPAVDTDYFTASNGYTDQAEETGYDDLMQEVEAAVMGRPPPTSRRRSDRASQASQQDRNSYSQSNGNIAQMGHDQYVNYEAYSEDSDAEAEAGLAAMRSAEQEEAADAARRQSGRSSHRRSQGSQRSEQAIRESPGSSDSDIHVDMSAYGGGFSAGGYHYGDDPNPQEYGQLYGDQGREFATARSSQRSNVSQSTPEGGSGLYDYPIPDPNYVHPFAPARVDTGGTGGLSDPGALPRRLSFEDGDEATLVDTESLYPSTSPSPSRQGLPDMFFHPGTGRRPLPAAPVDHSVPQLMPAGTYKDPEKLIQYDEFGRPRFPLDPDSYNQMLTPSGTPVPRSSSLVSHGSQPVTQQPIRSKTDADRAKILRQQQQQQSGLRSASIYGTDAFGDDSLNASAELLGLPTIPTGKRRKFNPAKLSTTDFKRCAEPWALSSITSWMKEMSEGESDLKEHAVVDGIVALFTHKVPTMNTADAEALGAKVVRTMLESGTLLKEEEWVKFGSVEMSGVLFQLTGAGCYSSRVHKDTLPGRCYAHHCMRTLKKINLQTQVLEPQRKAEDWATFYKVKKEDVENVDKKEIERQNNLHEIVTTEDSFMDQVNVLRLLYRDELFKHQPPIIASKRKDQFMNDVFGKVDAIKQVNEDFLLAQLKYRQQEQGPWISGFSDIFREWIRKARVPYIEYAASFPKASLLIRQEATRNLLFREFLDQIREDERSKRLGWDTYLKAPITKLQRYSLLLSVVHRHTVKDSEEKRNLATAIEEVKVVTMECDVRVAEMSKAVDLSELASKIQLRPSMTEIQLNLMHLGREIIYRGDLQRPGSGKLTWVDAHAILFDHYFVLAKVVEAKHPSGGQRTEIYDVSKRPIPMDLLVLESANDDPVVKSTLKGLGSVTTVTTRAGVQTEARPSRQANGQIGPPLMHTDTSSSTASTSTTASGKTLIPATSLDSAKDVMYPFKIRHLGHKDTVLLHAPSKQARQDWCSKIIEAKTRHAASLYKQNAEPFRLRVIADTAFAYEPMTGSGKGMVIKGTPLDRAIREVEKTFEATAARPPPVCRAAVNCATSFTQPNGTQTLAIGTDYGVFMTEHNSPRSWIRAIPATRVTQIAVLEEFSLFLILTDKTLIAHHLDAILPSSSSSSAHNNTASSSTQRPPQKLSGARDIGFFAQGRMKDRQLIFYKKREGVSSIFKVLEPIYGKNGAPNSTNASSSNNNNNNHSSMRSRFGGMVQAARTTARGGTTAFFREFDEFYIGSDTYAINLFHTTLAISTAKGFEILTLDKKLAFSIPNFDNAASQPSSSSTPTPSGTGSSSTMKDMQNRTANQRPLGMFRLSEIEFLLAFEDLALYVNKHGEVSRSVIMDYVGKAKQACLVEGMYLILICEKGSYVEVRNAINGRLRQVVAGRDVRLLDDGASGGVQSHTQNHSGTKGSVKVCMQHPEYERTQVVVEMLVNEGLKE